MKRGNGVRPFENRGPILRLLAQALALKFKPRPPESLSLDPQLPVEALPEHLNSG